MRKKIVAGNWKMNHLADAAYGLIGELGQYLIRNPLSENVAVVVAPPYLYLEAACDRLEMVPGIHVSAQNCHQEAAGAYTGEVAAAMVRAVGAEYVILGHSERRSFFSETDELIRQKLDAALSAELLPIFCCGEPEKVRDSGQHREWVSHQVESAVFHLDGSAIQRCTIAYEPVWAIGTGRTATPEQAQEMHHFIRSLIAGKYGLPVADSVSILYGGSCKPGNAAEIFSQPDVDGGLIGGASLKAQDFIAIIEAIKTA